MVGIHRIHLGIHSGGEGRQFSLTPQLSVRVRVRVSVYLSLKDTGGHDYIRVLNSINIGHVPRYFAVGRSFCGAWGRWVEKSTKS